MVGFIYEWTNNINGKMYIGSHMGTVDDGYVGSGKVFIRAIKKYGIEQFSRSIIEHVKTDDRHMLLEREKFWLDSVNAATNHMYYNIAKDVIGGDTKAGWSDERRAEFSQKIKNVWANRSGDEKKKITQTRADTIAKDPETYKAKIIAAQKAIPTELRSERGKNANYPTELRSKAAILSRKKMGREARVAAARKAAQNRNPETERLAVLKRRVTMDSYSDAKKAQIKKNRSDGRKGKCVGRKNGRARTISIDGTIYYTLKECIQVLKISEPTLYKRLKSDEWKLWKYL